MPLRPSPRSAVALALFAVAVAVCAAALVHRGAPSRAAQKRLTFGEIEWGTRASRLAEKLAPMGYVPVDVADGNGPQTYLGQRGDSLYAAFDQRARLQAVDVVFRTQDDAEMGILFGSMEEQFVRLLGPPLRQEGLREAWFHPSGDGLVLSAGENRVSIRFSSAEALKQGDGGSGR